MSAVFPDELFFAKLNACSLFQTYRQAFELATGYRLVLARKKARTGASGMMAPVPVGRAIPLFLVAQPGRESPRADLEYQSSIRGLLEAFALQLGEESNRIMVESDHAEPGGVQRAKQYVCRNLQHKIHLDDVAAAVGVCSFQLCRLFKKHTGMTMTEFVSRKRVQHAKRGLQDPGRQIMEIAEDAGFTSLSQFNRNFLKYAGESPTEYRLRMRELEHCDLASF
jgi:AraC-like DNA-binding protein